MSGPVQSIADARAQVERAPLGKNRDYNIFLVGQTISHIGNAVHQMVMPLLVLELTGSVSQMGLVATTEGVGRFTAGLVSGGLADRLDRRRLMLLCDLACVVISLSIPVLWWLGFKALWPVYVVAFTSGALSTCFLITQLSALPSLVGASHITAANGRLMAGYGTAMFVGPLIGGYLSHAIGSATTLAVDSATFVVSAISLLLIRFRVPGGAVAAAPSMPSPDETELVPGAASPGAPPVPADPAAPDVFVAVRFVWRSPVLRAVALVASASLLLVSGGIKLIIFHLKENLGHSDQVVGALMGVAAVGAVVSGVLAPRLRRATGFGALFLGAVVVEGMCIALMAGVDLLGGLMVIGLIYAFGNSCVGICSMSLRQELTPDHLLGRVTSAFWVLSTAAAAAGTAGASLLAEAIGVQRVFLILGLSTVGLGCVGLLTPARQRRPALDPDSREALSIDSPDAGEARAPAARGQDREGGPAE